LFNNITHCIFTIFCFCLQCNLRATIVLRHVDLSHNRIGNEGVADLVDGLYININLTHLSLAHNVFGDVGAVYLADLLKGNVALTNLDISNNQIGAKGAQAIASALTINQVIVEFEMGQYVVEICCFIVSCCFYLVINVTITNAATQLVTRVPCTWLKVSSTIRH